MLKADKRFSHKEWSENAIFDYLKQSYLLTSGLMQDTVDSVGEMDPKERRKAAFYTRYFVEAMNPANFFALNPEVLEATVNEKGENLVRGLKMMLADLERGKGKLLIRQTDMDAFEVGRNTAVSPGAVVFENDLIQLIQYAPATEKVYAKPLLIIPPWINKFYILDLNPKKSMVKWLVEQGHTVFVVSWVNPDQRHGHEDLGGLHVRGRAAPPSTRCSRRPGRRACTSPPTASAARMAGHADRLARQDRRQAGGQRAPSSPRSSTSRTRASCRSSSTSTSSRWSARTWSKGYMPADRMANAFNMLRANDLIWGYMVSNYMLGQGPVPVRPALLERRIRPRCRRGRTASTSRSSTSGTPSPRASSPSRGTPITLADIRGPVYHVATSEDHIAPAASVYRGAKEMKQAEVRFVLSGSGHIAGVVNPPVLGKYQFWTNPDMSKPTLEEWLQGAEETPGSWWPDWDAWLRARSRAQVPARAAGARLGALEAAPGSFVRVRFDSQ